MRDKLEKVLTLHEGKRYTVYQDIYGKLTIGRGRNLSDNGISDDEELLMFNNDVNKTIKSAKSFEWFWSLDDSRQVVVCDMIFNMGIARFKNFKKMIEAIINKDYNQAADEIVNSNYYKQVGARARWSALTMRTGIL